MTTRLLRQEFDTPLGPMCAMVVRDDAREALTLLEFDDRPRLPREIPELVEAFGVEPEDARAPLHDEAERQLAEYLAGSRTRFDLPLSAPGTDFQKRVWHALLEIPYGQTRSYGQIAERIGSVGAQRAVGAANGANRIAIVIPCHRVIEAGGGLRGYGGGLDRKRRLLEIEGAWPDSPSLFAPAGAIEAP